MNTGLSFLMPKRIKTMAEKKNFLYDGQGSIIEEKSEDGMCRFFYNCIRYTGQQYDEFTEHYLNVMVFDKLHFW